MIIDPTPTAQERRHALDLAIRSLAWQIREAKDAALVDPYARAELARLEAQIAKLKKDR